METDNKYINVYSILMFLDRYAYKYNLENAILKIHCPICKTPDAKIYLSTGNWFCELCRQAGDFARLQKIVAGDVKEIQPFNFSIQEKPMWKKTPALISQQESSAYIAAFQNELRSNTKMFSLLQEKYGVTKEMAEQSQFGWASRNLLPSDISYFRNRLVVPLKNIDGQIKVLRFKIVEGVPGISSYRSKNLNLWISPTAFVFTPSFGRNIERFWAVKDELVAIILDQILIASGLTNIGVFSPFSLPHILPTKWDGWNYLSGKPIIFFISQRKYEIDVAKVRAFDVGELGHIGVLPVDFSDFFSMLKSDGINKVIKTFLDVEQQALAKNQISIVLGNKNNIAEKETCNMKPINTEFINAPTFIECLQEIERMYNADEYPGYIYTSELANSLNRKKPYFLRHKWNWLKVRDAIRKAGIKITKKLRTKKGYRLYIEYEQIQEILKKFSNER